MLAYDLSVFDAPNNNARKGRRNALANKLIGAANEVGVGELGAAVEGLEDLLDKLDDAASPPDWMNSGGEKAALRNNVILIIGLIELEPH